MKQLAAPVFAFATVVVVGSCAVAPATSPVSIDCDETAGRTEEVALDDLTALVHLPPCYDANDGAYPTIYLLHGAGMTPSSWVDPAIGADVVAEQLMVNGEIAPVVLVLAPRSAAPDGFVERVMEPLVEAIERDYRVLDAPSSRAVGGFSAGGPATALSAFSGPARFGAVGFFATTWSDRIGETLAESMAERSDRPAVRIDVGDRDRLQGNVERIERDLDPLGLVPEVTVVPGSHDFEFVADRVDDWLIWFDDQRA